MKGTINIKQFANHAGTLFYLVCILLNSGYAYMLHDDAVILFALFLSAFVAILHFGILKRGFLRASFVGSPLMVFAVWILVSMFVHGDYSRWGTYVRQALVFLIALLFTQSVSIKVFASAFVRFVKIATIFSIAAWVLIYLLKFQPPLPLMHAVAKNIWYPDYYNGLIFFVNTQNTFRLMGPFWEPSVYACMTVLALFLQDAVLDMPARRKRSTAAVLIIGIILSFSTTGYFLLVLLAGVKAVRQSQKKTSYIITVVLIFASIMTVLYAEEIIGLLAKIIPTVFGKMTFESLSSMTRLKGPLVDLYIAADNPLIGVGASAYEGSWAMFASVMGVESRTSTITYFVANFGVLGLLYVYTMAKGILTQRNMSVQARILILCMFAIVVTSAPYYVNLNVAIIIAYLYRERIYSLKIAEA